MILARRRFLFGAAATLVAAPAIVRAASLMPVKAAEPLEWATVGTWKRYSGYAMLNLAPASAVPDGFTFYVHNNGAAPLTINPGPNGVIVGPGEHRSWPVARPPANEWRTVTLETIQHLDYT